jgi:di/tricarboxylate transporter
MNTFTAASAVLPVFAGKAIELIGYPPVFAMAAVCAVFACIAVARLRELRQPA